MKYSLPIGLSAAVIFICCVYLYTAYALSDNEATGFATAGIIYAVLWSVVLIVTVFVTLRLLGAKPTIALLPSLHAFGADLCVAAIAIAFTNAITSKAIAHLYIDDLLALVSVAAATVIWRAAAIAMANNTRMSNSQSG